MKGWFSYQVVDKVTEKDFYIELFSDKDFQEYAVGRFGEGVRDIAQGFPDDFGGSKVFVSTLQQAKNIDFTSEFSVFEIDEYVEHLSDNIIHEMGHLLGLVHTFQKKFTNEKGITFKQAGSIVRLYKDAKAKFDAMKINAPELDEYGKNHMSNGDPNIDLDLYGGTDPFTGESTLDLTDDQVKLIYQYVYDNFYSDSKQKSTTKNEPTNDKNGG